MKKLILILLLSTVMFSSSSYAGWTAVTVDINGNIHYVDFERIRKHDGYVYYWRLRNYLVPDEDGDLSSKVYKQGDCKLFRNMRLSSSYHTQPMGEGTPSTISNKPKKEWTYPSPDSVAEIVLKQVCNR